MYVHALLPSGPQIIKILDIYELLSLSLAGALFDICLVSILELFEGLFIY